MFDFLRTKYKNEHNLPKRMWLRVHLTEDDRKKYKNNFTQISGEKFIEIMNNRFTPFMNSIGFKGSKNNFYKKNSPLIYTINVLKDKYGGECSINVGVHLDYIENTRGDLPIPSRFKEHDCIISQNIPMSNGNSWYFYGLDEEEGSETVDLMIRMIQEKAISFFERFANYPHPFDKIGANKVLRPDDEFKEYGINSKMLSWIYFQIFLARFHYTNKNTELALSILNIAHEMEYNSERFTKKGISPLLKRIDELIKTYREH